MDLLGKDDPQTIAEAIRAAFDRLGGNVPVRVLARTVIDDHVVPAHVIEACTMRGVMTLCKKALGAETAERIPFAQPLGEHAGARWLQLDLFSQAQAYALIGRHSRALGVDHNKLRALQAWCLEKFGSAPEIPELIMPSDDLGDPDDQPTDTDSQGDQE